MGYCYVFEWLGDYEQRDPLTGKSKKDFFDLVYKIGVDITKALLSATLGTALVGGLIMFAGAIAGAPLLISVSTIVIGSIVAAIAIGLSLDYLDKKSEITERVRKNIKESIGFLEKKIPRDYSGYLSAVDFGSSFGAAP